MENDDNVVPTSDHEELEELAATDLEYWTSATRDIARRRNDIVVAAENTTPRRHAARVAAKEVDHRPLRTPPSADRPRKRRKLGEDQHASVESSPLVSSTNLSRPLSSSRKPAQTSPTPQMRPRPDTPLPQPTHQHEPWDRSTNRFPTSPTAWSPRLYLDDTRTPGAPNEASIASSANADHMGSPESRPSGNLEGTLAQKIGSESPTSSPDPISLFTPPRPQPLSPGAPQPGVVSPLLSPLTPTSSPAQRLFREHPPSPGPSRLPRHSQSPARVMTEETGSSHESAHRPLVTDPAPETVNLAAEFADQHDGRYSLRARKARQLNPYEYDKQLYKRQMRANPEAIVKVVSPPRPRRRHRSTSAGVREVGGSPGAEDEYEGGEEDDGVDEDARWERRMLKGKARAVDPPQSDDEPLGGPREKPARYPAVFDESPSGSSTEEEDAALDALQRQRERERRQKEKEERLKKRKPRPFPLHKKDLQPVTSPPRDQQAEESPPRPRPKPRPRPRGVLQPAQVHDDARLLEREDGSSEQHRQRSVTFTSPTRGSPPHAPLPTDDDFYTGWGDDFAQPDDLLQPASPMSLPLTPTAGTDEGASSEAHVPPHSSTPPDFIDISSDSDSDMNLPLRRRPRGRSSSRPGDPDSDSPSGSESGSQSSSSSIDEKDRKRMKVLQRMMPAVLIKRLEQKAAKPPPARRSVDRERSRGHEDGSSDDQGRPLRPGESRRRIRTQSNRSIEIRGDSESSDINIDVDMNDAQSPSVGLAPLWPDEEEIRPIAHQPRPRAGPSHRIATADISLSEESVDSGLSDGAESIIEGEEDNHRAPRRPRYHGEAREGDLIDRMLSRTHVSSGRRPKRKRRTGHGAARRQGNGQNYGERGARGRHGGGGSGRRGAGAGRGGEGGGHGSGLHFSTGGAKRYGSGRQTLLPFERLPTPEQPHRQDAAPAGPSSPTNEVRFEQEAPQKTKAKSKKHKPQTKLTGLYVFGSGGAHIVSGRVNSGHVTVDQEAEAAPYMRGAQALPGRRSKSHSKRTRVSSTADHPVTLEEFWALGGAEESDDSFVVPDEPLPQPASSQQRSILEHLNRVTVDLDIQPLPAGIAFPNTTYLGRGWLYELIHLLLGSHETPSPPTCSMFDCYLHPDMSVGAFNTCLESIYDQLRNLVFGALVPANYETCNKWQAFLHTISQHLSWLLAKSAGDVHARLAADTESLVQRLVSLMEEPVEILPDDEKPNPLVGQVLWFLTEASCRLVCDRRRRMEEVDPTIVSTCIKALMAKLWDFTFGDNALPLDLSREGLLKPSEGQQIAELWICLLDLTSDRAFEGLFLPSRRSFWPLYLEVLQTKGLQAPQTDLRAREAMWRSIFTLCALSQFSLHGNSTMAPRLTASWQTIAAVLERAPLSADPAVDASLSKRGLRKRDEYVRVLVSRCLWLNLKWHWRLDVDDASLVFNRLLDVFKSRRFANLADEPSDFPSFLRHNNLGLLHESKRSDTAFTLFLKLVVRAAEEMRKQNPQLAQATTVPPRLKKILSLAVPVGSVPFTKATPPSAHELSMLYNRFSAVAVAVYLEPTVANLKYRLANARRYVNFKDTDNETRRACIRGAMHLGTLLRHLDLPLPDILDWLGEMTNTLIDEYQAVEPGKGAIDTVPLDNARRYIVVCIQLILGCVRHILETSSMNPEENRRKYPDPALLQGPWVTRVFSTATTLSSVLSTGDQIRRLVQAFLDARSLVVPKPRRPQPRVVAEDSQESQYDYDQFDLDLDDPELLAALGEDVSDPEAVQNKEKDRIVCEIIDKHISPAIYRLVCKHFNDPVYKQSGELSFEDADRWIDCWVGCASVVVQNGKKDWDFYLSFGPQSWEKIIEPDWRRRVGLRFMYMLLQLDPPAYLTCTDLFIEVLFQSMATPTVTLEHEYTALLLSIDKLHHPLFHDLPVGAPGDDGDYHLSKQEFAEKRIAFLRVMFKNLTDSLMSESNGDHSLTARNQIHITTVSRFLETMQDIHDSLPPASVTHAAHRAFCKAVFTLLSEYPSLSNHARLTKHMTWLHSVSQ